MTDLDDARTLAACGLPTDPTTLRAALRESIAELRSARTERDDLLALVAAITHARPALAARSAAAFAAVELAERFVRALLEREE